MLKILFTSQQEYSRFPSELEQKPKQKQEGQDVVFQENAYDSWESSGIVACEEDKYEESLSAGAAELKRLGHDHASMA